MADKAETPKKPEEPKKKVKKLTIVDANEESPAETPAQEPEKKAETPPQPDDEDQAAIDAAFTDVSAEPAEPAKPASKKIAVSEAAPDEVVAGPSEEKAAEPVAAAAEPGTEASEEPAATSDALAGGETESKDTEDSSTLGDELSNEEASEVETTEEGSEAPGEEAPTAPPMPAKKPLSQLTNNVPTPPTAVPDIVADIEPDKEFADDQTADAVDDIVASESDELLAKEDEAAEQAEKPAKKSRSLKALISTWWNNPAARWGTIVGLVLVLMMVVALPASRYSILNAMGVRAASSMTVISNDSEQPLKNAQVTLAGQSATTDDEGKVTFKKLRLGKADLEITKRGFASLQQSRVLGWGSNPLGSIDMTVTGTRLIFNTKDFLSGKPVASAEAASGEYNAQADDKGKIILAVDQNADKDLDVTIKAEGYRDETLHIKLTATGEKTVQMVPARPRVFVSRRSGKLDVYKVDADGKNEAILLAATGKERNDLAVLQQPDGDYTAMVSTRLGAHNKQGYLLSNLFILNNKTAELTKLNESERVQLVDWTGDRIVFIAVTEGTSAANPSRSKLFSYQIGQPGAKQIASANYFNDATIFRGSIYYAPSSYAVPVSSVKFYKVNADGTNQMTLLSNEVWNIFRSDYDTLQLSVQQDWYELKSGNTPTKLTTAPANPKSRTYRDSPDGKHSLWVDSRDGKGVLIRYDVGAKSEETLISQSGLTQPIYWLNNTTVVYRVSDGHETADYVRSTEGGDAKKLKDVTTTDSSNYFN